MSAGDVLTLAKRALDGDAASLVRCIGSIAREVGSAGAGRRIVVPAPRPKPAPRYGHLVRDTRGIDESPIYDRIWFTSTTFQGRFFRSPLGQVDFEAPRDRHVSAKTRSDTNLIHGRLPDPESFEITAITFEPDADSPPAFAQWLRNETWFDLVKWGGQIHGHQNVTAQALLTSPSFRAIANELAPEHPDEAPTLGPPVLYLDRPIFIASNENFGVDLTCSRSWPGEPCRLRLVLHGWRYLQMLYDPESGRPVREGP